ncbi:MAG: HD-GYP domain-containing protein [Spirochaetales bacterium]|nr:HD-GYP domain-containing protein [Spirochaetales bacterium]
MAESKMAPRQIKVSDLKAGLRFDKPVYVEGDNLLVPENIEIKQKDIDRLTKWGISHVTTEGKPMKELPSANKNAFLQQAFSAPGRQEVMLAYGGLAGELQQVFTAVQNKELVKSVDVDDLVDRLLKLLNERQSEVVELILYGLQGESGFIENALNCAVLATLVGQNLNMVQHKLLQLASGALLHDVGMLRIPASVRSKQGELTPDEIQAIRAHPVYSYRIITREMKFAEEIGVAALQHQERWDGAGYPRQISGTNIIPAARIIAVADAFEAMVSKRPYRNSMIGYTAMRTILSDNARRFDPDIIKVFIRTMGIYPMGSVVLLNNASIGRVVDVNNAAPLRPRVKIMIDPNGREHPKDGGEIIDLALDKNLFIARAVDPKELAENNKGS